MADNTQDQNNIKQEYTQAIGGLDMDHSSGQIPKGRLSYALNAAVENFDSSGIYIQNEPGSEYCLSFPDGYVLIGKHFISEQSKHIFFITNPTTLDSQIGWMENNDCLYHTLVNAPCLNFSVIHPIHDNDIKHRITNCSTEIYWTDKFNPRRYLDIDNIPKILKSGSPLCSPIYTDDIDCNQLRVQSDFSIPQLRVSDVITGGNIIEGTYQFAAQYADAVGNPFTSYYSITNPTPIADIKQISVNFNLPVGKAIVVDVSNLDVTGQFQYINIAVIKTVNAISSVELIGTYFIEKDALEVIYSGQNVENIRLSINDIFEKYPYYDIAEGLTSAQDILIWNGLSSIDRINYQQIANGIKLWWETYRIPATENYANELNATNLRGYLRDEIYPFEFVPLSGSGKQYDGFHIPGKAKGFLENTKADVPNTNEDFIGEPTYYSGGTGYSPYWKIYNTASVTATLAPYSSNPKIMAAYKGPYQYGEMAYWESEDVYPCNTDVWGELAGQKIRHHKFPDVLVSPIYETRTFTSIANMSMGNDAVFPIGVKVDVQQIQQLINSSNLTQEQKDDIVGFKIVRGDRATNKSIVAKGILRNVGIYTRDDKEYFYPNYPYNDLNADPFLNSTNNAYSQTCQQFSVNITTLINDTSGGVDYAEIEYQECNKGKTIKRKYYSIGLQDNICAIEKPILLYGDGYVDYIDYDEYWLSATGGYWTAQFESVRWGIISAFIPLVPNITLKVWVIVGTRPKCISGDDSKAIITFKGRHTFPSNCTSPTPLPEFTDKYRQIFNSPETSFGQPFLGNILKLENVMFGKGLAHFAEVKNNAKYKLITEQAQKDALDSSAMLGAISAEFNVQAMFAAYQAYLTIYLNSITRKNFAYSYNSIADYNYSEEIKNDLGIKQRNLDLKQYLIPTVESVGDVDDINNWNRETSVFLRTDIDKTALPFPSDSPEMLNGTIPIITDYSRFTISDVGNCGTPSKKEDITTVSYYASLKNDFINQWGQIYSYNTIDTGYQQMFDSPTNDIVFGGDTFISRFAFKTKLPFFINNRVNAPDDSDIFYDELGNVGYPKYWHSARSIFKDYSPDNSKGPGTLMNIISYKAHNFDCPNYSQNIDIISPSTTSTTTSSTTTLIPGAIVTSVNDTNYDGYFYLFAYGIPYFYCESSYNTDLRQAFNNREGDFWPHVSTTIPDDWMQESFVSIANDNTYNYNVTYSKQNKENLFTHLPPDWANKFCLTHYPFRAIYSDPQDTDADNRINSWRIYRALSYFDFPQNYGQLTSLDGIQNKEVLARFENKALLYNHLLTIDTSNPQAAYVGNPNLFKNPPIDYADTDLGYLGSQNKFFLKIPQGNISADAKRGQVFILSSDIYGRPQADDITGFGSGLNRFFTDHLAFEILRYFPNANVDNHFNGLGLHGVYDSKYDRVIITKLDYVPIDENIKYDPETGEFYYEEIITSHVYECELWGTAIEIGEPTTSTTTTISTTIPTTTTTTTSTTNIPPQIYGILYNWYAANNDLLPPEGWRVPVDTEWDTLAMTMPGAYASTNFIGHCSQPMKSTGNTTGAPYGFGLWTISADPLSYEGTNASEFNITPSGVVTSLETINGRHNYSNYWAYNQRTLTLGHYKNFGYSGDTMYENVDYYDKHYGFNVRCVKEDSTGYPSIGDEGTVTDIDGNIYPTKRMPDGLVWMVENLRTQRYNDGSSIPIDPGDWTTRTEGAIHSYTDPGP